MTWSEAFGPGYFITPLSTEIFKPLSTEIFKLKRIETFCNKKANFSTPDNSYNKYNIEKIKKKERMEPNPDPDDASGGYISLHLNLIH